MTRKAKKGSKRKRQKAGLNRSILDVGWSQLTQAIKYKLEEGGGIFVEVPTKTVKPTQRCPKCLDVQPKTLDVRIHHCCVCNYLQDRDLATAAVMLLWATNSGANGSERPKTWSLKLYRIDQRAQALRIYAATRGFEASAAPFCWWGFRNPTLAQLFLG